MSDVSMRDPRLGTAPGAQEMLGEYERDRWRTEGHLSLSGLTGASPCPDQEAGLSPPQGRVGQAAPAPHFPRLACPPS